MSSQVWAFVVPLFCLLLLSRASTFSLTSTFSLSWTLTSMWSSTSSIKPNARSIAPEAICDPLTQTFPFDVHFDCHRRVLSWLSVFRRSLWVWRDKLSTSTRSRGFINDSREYFGGRDYTLALFLTILVGTSETSPCTSEEECCTSGTPPQTSGMYFASREVDGELSFCRCQHGALHGSFCVHKLWEHQLLAHTCHLSWQSKRRSASSLVSLACDTQVNSCA